MSRDHDARILILCTANQCRSPAAEALLRARLDGTGITVASAGFAVRTDAPVDPRTRELVPGLPVDQTTQQLTPAMLVDASLVLTMTLQHRTAAVGLAPSVVRRTFTLTEFADLAALVAGTEDLPAGPAERLTHLVAAAPRMRGARRASPVRDDDVADPYLVDTAAYRVLIAQIAEASDAVASHVLGAVAALAGDRA